MCLLFQSRKQSYRRWRRQRPFFYASTPEINYFTMSVSFSRPINPKPMSRTSGHILTTNIINNTERTVVRTRTLEKIVTISHGNAEENRVKIVYLVLRNGMRIPAAVAVSKSTTWRIVKTTLINFTTKARAFELSIPSTVNCCWDKCSIFWICKEWKE